MGPDESFDPVAIATTLRHHGVRFVVVGGFAVAAWGVVRATEDLDVVIDVDWDNAQRLGAALRELDAIDEADSSTPLTPEALVRRVDRRFVTSAGRIHVLHRVPGIPGFRDLLPASEVDFEGVAVPVASLAQLRAMKRAAGRSKDLVDLEELDELHGPESG